MIYRPIWVIPGLVMVPLCARLSLLTRRRESEPWKIELNHLIEDGFNPADIVVLSPYSFDQSWVSYVAKALQVSITVLDSSSARADERHAIGFAQIGDFKGLESEVVLVDMPFDKRVYMHGHAAGSEENIHSLYYVGMSRARALLSMICKESDQSKMETRGVSKAYIQ